MTNQDKINKFLTEWSGLQLHYFTVKNHAGNWICSCGGAYNDYKGGPSDHHLDSSNPDFFTPDGFFKLIELIDKKGLLERVILFLWEESGQLDKDGTYGFPLEYLEDKETFAPAVARFLGMEEC